MIPHCKSTLIYNGESWQICSILTLTKPITKMKCSIHFGPKICSKWRLELLNLQFLASGDAWANSCYMKHPAHPPPSGQSINNHLHMKVDTERPPWGGIMNSTGSWTENMHPRKLKIANQSSSNLHFEHILGPKWSEVSILEIGLVKVKIELIWHDFPL